ncbi:MAG: lactonase family protein [Halobacteriales archaeon]
MGPPDALPAFVGTYTEDESDSEGIYGYHADPASGDLDPASVTDAGENPSFLAFGPDGEYLYAVNQVMEGGLVAFEVTPAGDLDRLNRQPTEDQRPCHVALDATGTVALVAHYTGGSVAALPVEADGRLAPASDVIEHEHASGVTDRQTEPHPHSINPGPENRFAYVPDLGADRVYVYGLDPAGTLDPADPPFFETHAGAGPRHMDFHPNGRWAYVINELDSTLTAVERDPETGALSEIGTVGTLPPEFEGENTTAEVQVHPSGEYVYGSNRGHDSIAVFAIDDEGRPERIQVESTRGEWPRNFALDPEGRYLYAENRDTNDVVAFAVGDDGRLSATGHAVDVPEPVCLVFRHG